MDFSEWRSDAPVALRLSSFTGNLIFDYTAEYVLWTWIALIAYRVS